MAMQYFITNAFTSKQFSGNPATIVVPVRSAAKNLTAAQMQRLAGELSAVETCFVLPASQPKTDFELKFFTKKSENPFCGHATIAAAHILAAEFGFRSKEFFFTTKSGIVIVRRIENEKGRFFEMDLRPSLPTALPAAWANRDFRRGLIRALNITLPAPPGQPGKGDTSKSSQADGTAAPLEDEDVVTDIVFHAPSKNVIVLLAAAWCVVRADPDLRALLRIAPTGVSKLTITAVPVQQQVAAIPKSKKVRDGEEKDRVAADLLEQEEARWRPYHFVTRLFAPWFGIPEDAVSGASHAILARLWVSRREELQKQQTLRCFQPSPRGGEIIVNVHDPERIGIAGESVSIAHGAINDQFSHL